MKNLIILLSIGLAAIASGFMFIQKEIPLSAKEIKTEDPKKDALKDIKNNDLKILTYGMPMPEDVEILKDSIAQLLGFRYQSIAGCVVDEATVNYIEQYNQVIKKHLTQKHGPNWENCMSLQMQILQYQSYAGYTAEELANHFVILDVDLLFPKGETSLNPNDLLLLEANSIGIHNIRDEQQKNVQIQLKAYYAMDEDKKVAKKRLQNVIDQLKAFGLTANNIKVLGIEKGEKPDCKNCPFNFEQYPQRVELRFGN
jgi:hypothetical protein